MVNGIEDPDGFSESEERDPSAVFDEGIGGGGLTRVVSGDEADEDVGVNGAHGFGERGCGGLL